MADNYIEKQQRAYEERKTRKEAERLRRRKRYMNLYRKQLDGSGNE